jgi:hypothetical protein
MYILQRHSYIGSLVCGIVQVRSNDPNQFAVLSSLTPGHRPRRLRCRLLSWGIILTPLIYLDC